MPKNARTLDTPFRKGEKVQTTEAIADIAQGTEGKVKLANGLGNWRRYWVMFPSGEIRGQISHEQLVRPSQLEDWHQREVDREQAALRSAEATEAVEAATDAGGGGENGLAALVPAHILDRSRAAKARLTGG